LHLQILWTKPQISLAVVEKLAGILKVTVAQTL
jgi:hypothetical protein